MSAPPGFFAAALAIAAKDLRIEGRTRAALVATILFALVALVVFAFAFDADTLRGARGGVLVPAILWVTAVFAGIVGFTRSFAVEARHDAWSALALAPVDRGAIYAGKLAANVLLLAVLEAVLALLVAVLFDVDLRPIAGSLLLVLGVHALGLAELGTLFGAVATRLARGEALVATLLLPAATPLLLSAVHCTRGLLEEGSLGASSRWLALASGLDVLYFLVALLVFDAILEDG